MIESYLITSREFYTDTSAVFRKILHEQLVKHTPSYALYRDKTNPNYKFQAEHFVEVCSQFQAIKSFIHRDADLAKSLNATGVHLTSTMFDKIEYAKSLGLEVIVSTHTLEDVQEAESRGADAVTYSPIFASPGKGEAKGVAKLASLVKKVNIKVFGLGGILNQEDVDAIKETNAYGFASIRYFYKDTE